MSEVPPALQAPPAAPPTHTLAIVSLVAGVLGLTICGIIGSVVALATGYLARDEIRKNPGAYSGDGMATAGMVLGGAGLAWMCIWLLFVLVFMGLFFIPFFIRFPSSRQGLGLLLGVPVG